MPKHFWLPIRGANEPCGLPPIRKKKANEWGTEHLWLVRHSVHRSHSSTQRVWLLLISMILLLGGTGRAPAQGSGTFQFCIVQLRDAGDPMVDQYRATPEHWYFSGIYSSDADESKQFLAWAQGDYGREWTVVLSQPNSGIGLFYRSYSTPTQARKALGSPA